jgi:DNA-binding phage protein
MSAKIVSLPTKVPKSIGNLPDIDGDYTTVVRAFVNSKVRMYVAGKGNMNRLALKAGISYNTVHKLAYYETTHPRWHTVMSVIMALDAMTEFADLTTRYAQQYK